MRRLLTTLVVLGSLVAAVVLTAAKGDDPFGYRAEFVNLVRLAKTAQALEPLKP